MNKTELVAAVATKADLSKKDAEAAVKAVIDSVTEALADGDKVALVGFGTFDVKKRAARTGKTRAQAKPSKSLQLRFLPSRLAQLLRTL
jgi:DNA-binding protein HU-beta